MTRIKICGMTSERDIRILNAFLPEYAGFVFAESRRRVTAEMSRNLSEMLHESIKKVGVFVDMPVWEVGQIVEKAGLDVVQLHGDENMEYVRSLRKILKPGTEVWKAFRVDAVDTLDEGIISLNCKNVRKHDKSQILSEMKSMSADRYLLDAFVKGTAGGTGKKFDWNLFRTTGDNGNMILAGGLSPSNVKEAISSTRPFAVDVSSGVEIDGYKDARLVMEFINNVRGQ